MCEILLVVEKKLDKDPFKDIAIFFSILHRIFPVFFLLRSPAEQTSPSMQSSSESQSPSPRPHLQKM